MLSAKNVDIVITKFHWRLYKKKRKKMKNDENEEVGPVHLLAAVWATSVAFSARK